MDETVVNAVPRDALEPRPADELCLMRHGRLPDSEGACDDCRAIVHFMQDRDVLPAEAMEVTPAIIAVLRERQRQDEKWGGPDRDDDRDLIYWSSIVSARAGQISLYAEHDRPAGWVDSRDLFIEIAAIAVAAVEAIDRRMS